MLIQHEWHSYNPRRYGKPWAAKISFDGTKPVYEFTGLYSNGILAFDAEPGEIVAMGQKDTRGGNTSNDWYVVTDAGISYLQGGKVEALQLHREREGQDVARDEPSVQVVLVAALEAAHDEIHHPGAARHRGEDVVAMIQAALALAKGSPTPTENVA